MAGLLYSLPVPPPPQPAVVLFFSFSETTYSLYHDSLKLRPKWLKLSLTHRSLSLNPRLIECLVFHNYIYPEEGVLCYVHGCQGLYHIQCAKEKLQVSNLKKFKCPQHARWVIPTARIPLAKQRKLALSRIGKLWRGHKSELKDKYCNPGTAKEDLLQLSLPEELSKDNKE